MTDPRDVGMMQLRAARAPVGIRVRGGIRGHGAVNHLQCDDEFKTLSRAR